MSDELRAAATLFALTAVVCLTVTAAAGGVALTATAPADTPADPTPTPETPSNDTQNVTEQLSTPELPHNCDWKRSAIRIEPCQSSSA